MAQFGSKAVNIIVILASVLQISDAIHGINPVPKILLDVGSVIPRGFVVRALAAKFVSKSPIWIQLWNGTAFRQGHSANYTLIWQVEVSSKLGDGAREVVRLGDKYHTDISDEGIHLAVYSLVRPSALSGVFNQTVGNLHLSDVGHCQRHERKTANSALSVNVSCTFDKLRWPYALPLKLCSSSDCSDLSIDRRWSTDVATTTGATTSASTSPETSAASTAPVTTTDKRQVSDEHSEAIKVTHDRDVRKSSEDLKNTVIGLIIWNVFLSVLLLIVAVSIIIAHSNISHIRRIHWYNRGMYVVNKPTKNAGNDDKRERNGSKHQDLGLSAC